MLDFISNFWGMAVVLAILTFIIFKVYRFQSLVLADVRAQHARKILHIRSRKFETATQQTDAEIDVIRSDEKEIEILKLKSLAVSILFCFIAAVFCLYLWKFNSLAFGETADVWGQMGDYFGGMLNPIFAFASFMALLYTIRIQSEELRLTRSELAASRAAQEDSSKALNGQLQSLKIQQFETTFFSLIGQIRNSGVPLELRDKILSHVNDSDLTARSEATPHTSSQEVQAAFSSFVFDKLSSTINVEVRYFSLMAAAIIYIDESFENEVIKKKYLSILGTYANDMESYLLFLWLSKFNEDFTGEKSRVRTIINRFGFFRALRLFSGFQSLNTATIHTKHELKHDNSKNRRLRNVTLVDAGFYSSCMLGFPLPEIIPST